MHSLPPLEAKVLPDPPAPRPLRNGAAWSWILAGSVFLAFVAMFAILLWGIGFLIRGHRRLEPERSGSLIQAWETPSQRLTAIKSALAATDTGCSPAELRELDRLFGRIAAGAHLPPTARLETLFDSDALADRVLRHPALASAEPGTRERIRRQIEYDNEAWPDWTEFTVVSLTRGTREEALVYTVAEGNGLDPAPVRWWLRRRGRAWRICDWERIDVGYSEAARRALDEALLARNEQSTYRRATAAMQSASTNQRTNNIPLAAQQLLDAQELTLPDLAHDFVNLELAFVWHACSRPDQIIAATDRVRKPAEHPGVYYLRSLAHAEREQFAETIAAAAQYRAAAGLHPHLLELEAEALEALGRQADAAACWQQRLTLAPKDSHALSEFCRLAGAQAATRLAAALQRSRDPVQLAVEAGLSASLEQNDATFEPIVEFLKSRADGNVARMRLRAEHLEDTGQIEAAAEAFHEVMQQASDLTTREAARDGYLRTMVQRSRAAAAYRGAAEQGDPDEVLQHLTLGIEEGDALVTFDDLPQVLAAHRKRSPGDQALPYYQGLVEMEQGRYLAAERTFAAGEQSTDDDEWRVRMRSQRREALYRQDLVVDAYHAYADDRELAFQEIGWLCRGDRNWQALGELIAMHRRKHADDPWIEYFSAVRDEAMGNDAEALAAVRRVEQASDSALSGQIRLLKDNLLIRSEGITQAYLNSVDQREAFRSLVNHLAAAEDWEGILELTELHSASGTRRASSIYWAAKAQWNCGEYEQIAGNFSPWPYARLSRLDGQQLAELYDIVVRSLLRLGRIDDAAETARQARDEYGLELPQMAVALAKRDHMEIRGLLSQRRIASALFHQQLFRDRDLESLLTAPEVADIRRRHALAWPHEYGPRNVSLVLFFDQPLAGHSLQSRLEAVAALGPPSEIAAADGRQSWCWNVGADTLVVTHASGNYCSCDEAPAWLAADDPRRKMLEQHGGWAAVDLLPADQAIKNSPVRLAAARASAALAQSGAVGCYVVGPRGRISDPLLLDDAVLEQIESGKLLRAEHGVAGSDRLFLTQPDVALRKQESHWRLQRDLTRLAHRSRVVSDGGHARIRVRLARGHAAEDQWLNVIRSRPVEARWGHSRQEFIGEMTADSQLWPHLKRGERLIFGLHEPLEVLPASSSASLGK